MNPLLARRVGLAVLSGAGVAFVRINESVAQLLGDGTLIYAVSGAIFAAGVLFPYLKRDDRVLVRAISLVIASGLSYYVAVWLATESPFSVLNELISYTVASIAGAAIVMTAFVLATPTQVSGKYVLWGFAAGLVGGPITSATLPYSATLAFTGHAIWHTLVCVAIHVGTGNRVRTGNVE